MVITSTRRSTMPVVAVESVEATIPAARADLIVVPDPNVVLGLIVALDPKRGADVLRILAAGGPRMRGITAGAVAAEMEEAVATESRVLRHPHLPMQVKKADFMDC